ncbi:hypothetical protein DEIPH_ctg021orf0077 [Deinococcus phoenicis]|uniref:Uncharacterized protein n=1 Tax=Deinococcus phoenicis TaxID=1476583 RepID=A0A016QR96_9DEIO|nr:hypothetical protein [Deinococcus phoenicis]EYB68558.1 hypothetical protein DEIPH_ctg021orf0077 [Deinococcus phoenicis]
MDFFQLDRDERARARPLPALNAVLLQALAGSLPAHDYAYIRAGRALRATYLPPEQERLAQEEAVRGGWLTGAGNLTEAGRSAAFALLAVT